MDYGGYSGRQLEHVQSFIQILVGSRLVTDLNWCYKIVFRHVDVDIGEGLNIRPVSRTRGHDYKYIIKVIPLVLVVPFSVSVS